MTPRFIPVLFLCFLWACSNIDDAEPSKRTTFVRFFESSGQLAGVQALPTDDGYLVLANSVSTNDTSGVLIQTDLKGQTLKRLSIAGGNFKSIVRGDNAYYIIGDSVKTNPEADQLVDLITYSALIYKIDFEGNVLRKTVIADQRPTGKTDFRSNAITVNAEGNIIILGSFKAPQLTASEKPFVLSLDPLNLDTVWNKTYEVLERDYVNSKSVHATNDGHIVWASAMLREQQSFTRSYLSIPYIKENAVFENFSVYGENSDQKLLANDLVPAASAAFGFGVIGTYASTTGENSNMFFARVTQDGNIIQGSERFFDAVSNNLQVNAGVSLSEDSGDAICATSDGGFVLAGTMMTTPTRGNGGKDIFLVKVDGAGSVIWNKTLGGSGDEVVTSIRETPDKGLLLCGSKDASGLPALFIIKTDSEGEIQN